MCGSIKINENWAKIYNDAGMEFSQNDLNFHSNNYVDGYLGVSDRSCVKVDRDTGNIGVVAGLCSQTPLKHKAWSKP